MYRASTSLPMPLSPVISTDESKGATRLARSSTRRKALLRTSTKGRLGRARAPAQQLALLGQLARLAPQLLR